MQSKDELREIDIKNRVCCYFNDIINDIDIKFNDILLDEKSYKYVPVYNISYKTSAHPKPLRIGCDKIDRFIRVRGSEFWHLVSFGYGFVDKICDNIKYLIKVKKWYYIALIIILENQNWFISFFTYRKNIDFS